MKKSLLTLAAASFGLAAPVHAITFPSLTTIYVASGAYDDGSGNEAGEATSIHCSNVSGVAVQVRAVVLSSFGTVEGSLTANLVHGATFTFSTHPVEILTDNAGDLNTGAVNQGVVNVEATNSAVFCTAVVMDAAGNPPIFMSPLHLVRVNPHPGTVE